MKKALLFLVSFFAGVIIFVCVGKTVGWEGIKSSFLILASWQGAVIFGLTLITILISNWRWNEILRGLEVRISYRHLMGTYLAGFALMYLVPILLWGGELFRGYVLKERNKVLWPKAMASVVIDRIMEWTLNLAVISVGVLFFVHKIGFPSSKLLIIISVLFFVLVLAVCFFYFKTIKKESIAKAVGKIFIQKLDNQPLDTEKEIFDFFKFKNKSMWRSFFLSFLRVVLMYLRVWVLVIFLGKNIGGITALAILGFSYLAVMIPIPASLGSHEAIQTFVFKSLNLGTSSATVFTMLIRATEIVFALAGLIILARIWTGLIKKIFLNKVEKLVAKH